ncbi:MAG: hypothetical protein IPH11_17150 [Ignavibacteriales bacterium]|nr:hypothetical protein [Ignavibacteriales bacterium]
MKNKFWILSILFILGTSIFAQEITKEESKFNQLASKTGTIIKFIDYKLSRLEFIGGGSANSTVRKLIINNEPHYFYYISIHSRWGNDVALTYDDFLALSEAMEKLKKDSAQDLALHLYYLENKFITEDGFELGYSIDSDKLTWYLVDNRFTSKNILLLSNLEILENSMKLAEQKFKILLNK